MLVFLASLAFADKNVHTFVTDPQYTPAPFAGLERLYVDPAVTASSTKPAPARPAGELAVDPAGKGAVVLTNPMSQWAEVTVGGTKVGTIGPFATMTLEGYAPGYYAVDLNVSTGFTRHFSVEVLAK